MVLFEIHGWLNTSARPVRRLQSAFFHPSRIGQLNVTMMPALNIGGVPGTLYNAPDGNCVAGNLDPLPPSQ